MGISTFRFFVFNLCLFNFLTIFLISFDRFLATFVPLRYAAIFNQSRITLCVILAWCFSLIIASSVVFGYFIFYGGTCPLFIMTTILVLSRAPQRIWEARGKILVQGPNSPAKNVIEITWLLDPVPSFFYNAMMHHLKPG